MKISKSFGIIFVILFTSQMLLIHSSGNIKYTNFSAQQDESSTPYEEITFISEAAPGFENIKSNVIRDGGFEEIDSDGGPEYFYYGGDGYEISNATYQDDVHFGSYGLFVSAEGTYQISTTTYSGRSLTSVVPYLYLDQDITLDMWFKVKANPDIASGAASVASIQLYTGSQTYYLYYYFSQQNAPPSHTSTQGHFDVRQPVGSWYHLQRNLTLDFETAFPSVPIIPSIYFNYMQFRVTSIVNPAGPNEMLFDDFSMTNGTGYNIMAQNGDFEDGNGFRWDSFRRGPAFFEITNKDFTQGSHSLNITASAYYENGFCSMYCQGDIAVEYDYYPNSFYPTAPGQVVVDYDWKYSETENGGYNQDAYQYFYLQNESFMAYIYFYLGEDTNTIPSSNYTYPTYMFRYYSVPGFGSRDTWEHFHLDLYDFYQIENLGDLIPTSIGFGGNAGQYKNSSVSLLIDDLSIIADPLGDSSFELDTEFATTDPLYSWTSSDHNFVNRTTDAHTGNYAANVTLSSVTGTYSGYRRAFLPTEENLYTDFWWRLDDLSGPSYAQALIKLEFDYSYNLYYKLGLLEGATLSNSTYHVYINVENQNQTGIWCNLFRNVQNDAHEAFGIDNWNITRVTFECYSSGTSKVSAIFDDFYFVRDVAGPDITGLAQSPIAPEYGEAVTIEVDVADNIEVLAVEMVYKVDAGSWIGIPMTHTGGVHYEAGISAYYYGTVVQYYFIAYDIYGHQTPLGSESIPFEYTVADTVDPILNVERPLTTEPIVGNAIFNITGDDPGSGIASFEIVLDTETVFSDAIVPADYTWETTYHDNGNHTIIFALEDNAGNNAILELEYTVENLVPWYVRAKTFLQKWYPYITAGAGALIIGSFTLAIVIRVRKRRKAA